MSKGNEIIVRITNKQVENFIIGAGTIAAGIYGGKYIARSMIETSRMEGDKYTKEGIAWFGSALFFAVIHRLL